MGSILVTVMRSTSGSVENEDEERFALSESRHWVHQLHADSSNRGGAPSCVEVADRRSWSSSTVLDMKRASLALALAQAQTLVLDRGTGDLKLELELDDVDNERIRSTQQEYGS